MWRWLVLCLAAAPALGFDDNKPPKPKFTDRFTMTFEDSNYIEFYFLSYNVWYDRPNNMVRIDTVDTKSVIAGPSKKYKYGDCTMTFPVTTATNKVKPACRHDNGSADAPCQTSNFLPLIEEFKFLRKERVHDQNAYIWGYNVTLFNILQMRGECALIYTNDETIPLRLSLVGADDSTGMIVIDYVRNYYDFQPVQQIAPDTWNIHKGITCEEKSSRFSHKQDAVDQITSLIKSSVEDPDSPATRKQIEKFIKRYTSYKFERESPSSFKPEESTHQVSTVDVPAPEPDNALPFPFTESEIGQMARDLPEEFDWRILGAVTYVKHIFRDIACDSAWAFAATGAIEGYQFLKNGKEQVLLMSEQILIDCTWGFGNNGCFGGSPVKAFDWVKKYGIPTSANYRKYNQLNNACNFTHVPMVTKIKGYTRIPKSEEALKVALHKFGPVSAEITVVEDLAYYNGGIYKRTHCRSNDSMYVLVVGYGVLDGQKYWIVKLPLSTVWGANGYLLLAVDNNLCGIQNNAYSLQ